MAREVRRSRHDHGKGRRGRRQDRGVPARCTRSIAAVAGPRNHPHSISILVLRTDASQKAPDEAALLQWFRISSSRAGFRDRRQGRDRAAAARGLPDRYRPGCAGCLDRSARRRRGVCLRYGNHFPHYMQADLVGVSFAVEPARPRMPFGHSYMGAPDQLDRDEVLSAPPAPRGSREGQGWRT